MIQNIVDATAVLELKYMLEKYVEKSGVRQIFPGMAIGAAVREAVGWLV